MKASVTTGVGRGFEVQEVEIGIPLGREVSVQVKASGLCHSDLHFTEHDFGTHWPAVLGHEAAGVVTAVGPDVQGIEPGDHVVACMVQFCGNCSNCLAGRSVTCSSPQFTLRHDDQPARLRAADGSRINQFVGVGGFAEQILVHENQLAVVTDRIPFSQASVIGCAVVTGVGAAIHAANVRAGETVVVLGVGGVGLNVISGARLAGAIRIIAVDVHADKLETARKFGATDVVDAADTDPVAEVNRLTRGGVDHAFEAIGLGATQQQAIEMAAVGGQSYFLGMAEPGTSIALDTSLSVIREQKGVRGVRMGSANTKRDIPLYAEMYVQGRLNLDDLVTQEISIDQIDEAYEQLKRGGPIRSVVTSF